MYKPKYFKYEEFESDDLPGSGRNMDSTFLQMLDNAREHSEGTPFVITSGYRTEQKNTAVGGKEKTASSKGSSHLYGYAADIACMDSSSRQKITTALIKAGFNRIGIAKSFIHVDNDPDKPAAFWLYS